VTSAPTAQTALDSVAVDWASHPPLDVKAGAAELFDDPRMRWGFERLGGLDGRSVLELGPLQGVTATWRSRPGRVAL
jgi:hypothetical protein